MINNIDSEHVQHIAGSSQPHRRDAASHSRDDVNISINMSFDDLVAQALQEAQTGVDDVRVARELLLSGQLEDLESIREAANNMLKLGV